MSQTRADDRRHENRPRHDRGNDSSSPNSEAADNNGGESPLAKILAKLKGMIPAFRMPTMPSLPNFRARGEHPTVTTDATGAINPMKYLPYLVTAVLAIVVVSPLLIRVFAESLGGLPQPGWFGGRIMDIGLRQAPPYWRFMTDNMVMYAPWALWMLNVPLLMWQLKKERTIAGEMGDWWLVLTAAIVFWFVRTSPAEFWAMFAHSTSWVGNGTFGPAQVDLVVFGVALVAASIGAIASYLGQKDLTPFSMTCVIIAIIWKGYDVTSNDGWAKLFLAVGVLAGIAEILREPRGRGRIDRAGAFGLVIGAVVVFAIVRSLVVVLITANMEKIANPPSWYVEVGKGLYANANVAAIIIAGVVAWLLRFQAATLLFKVIGKVTTVGQDYLTRLTPDPTQIKFWDTTILSHFAIIAVWLFLGGL